MDEDGLKFAFGIGDYLIEIGHVGVYSKCSQLDSPATG
jgi:hypothetical protein